jgi:hypothetical protein
MEEQQPLTEIEVKRRELLDNGVVLVDHAVNELLTPEEREQIKDHTVAHVSINPRRFALLPENTQARLAEIRRLQDSEEKYRSEYKKLAAMPASVEKMTQVLELKEDIETDKAWSDNWPGAESSKQLMDRALGALIWSSDDHYREAQQRRHRKRARINSNEDEA